MIAHADAVTIIEGLKETLPRAPELLPAEWARLIVSRQAVHTFIERGGSLADAQHAAIREIDDLLLSFAHVAWPAFAAEYPQLAQVQPAWWTRLRDANNGEQDAQDD